MVLFGTNLVSNILVRIKLSILKQWNKKYVFLNKNIEVGIFFINLSRHHIIVIINKLDKKFDVNL